MFRSGCQPTTCPDVQRRKISNTGVQAHEQRCTDVRWHPHALSPGDDGGAADTAALAYATASADATAKLWNMDGACLSTLAGHTSRLARAAFHPSGAIRAACNKRCVLPYHARSTRAIVRCLSSPRGVRWGVARVRKVAVPAAPKHGQLAQTDVFGGAGRACAAGHAWAAGRACARLTLVQV